MCKNVKNEAQYFVTRVPLTWITPTLPWYRPGAGPSWCPSPSSSSSSTPSSSCWGSSSRPACSTRPSTKVPCVSTPRDWSRRGTRITWVTGVVCRWRRGRGCRSRTLSPVSDFPESLMRSDIFYYFLNKLYYLIFFKNAMVPVERIPLKIFFSKTALAVIGPFSAIFLVANF